MTLWFRCSFIDLLKALPAFQTDSKDIRLREIFPFVMFVLVILLLASSPDALIGKSKFRLE